MTNIADIGVRVIGSRMRQKNCIGVAPSIWEASDRQHQRDENCPETEFPQLEVEEHDRESREQRNDYLAYRYAQGHYQRIFQHHQGRSAQILVALHDGARIVLKQMGPGRQGHRRGQDIGIGMCRRDEDEPYRKQKYRHGQYQENVRQDPLHGIMLGHHPPPSSARAAR
jgi:hypothetical protein